jgi:hypothetical protein
MTNTELPPAHEIYARVFNAPEKVRRLARLHGVSVNHAYKWLRGGESSAPSNLERVMREMFLASTFGDEGLRDSGLMADYLREVHVSTVEMSAEPYADERERVGEAVEILREASEAVEALSLGKPTPETVKELVELRDKAEAAISRLCAVKGAGFEELWPRDGSARPQ